MEPELPTFAEAIAAGASVFQKARESLNTLSAASDGAGKSSTVEGALREQEERVPNAVPALKQPKSKQKSSSVPTGNTHPGYKIGVAAYTSPFWTLVEVGAAPQYAHVCAFHQFHIPVAILMYRHAMLDQFVPDRAPLLSTYTCMRPVAGK